MRVDVYHKSEYFCRDKVVYTEGVESPVTSWKEGLVIQAHSRTLG